MYRIHWGSEVMCSPGVTMGFPPWLVLLVKWEVSSISTSPSESRGSFSAWGWCGIEDGAGAGGRIEIAIFY